METLSPSAVFIFTYEDVGTLVKSLHFYLGYCGALNLEILLPDLLFVFFLLYQISTLGVAHMSRIHIW